MGWFDIAITLFTLVVLEIVLGIDNLIFLSILTEKLPIEKRKKARYWGLTFAWVTRLGLLAFAVVLVKLNNPLFKLGATRFSIHTLFLLLGGLFLIAKSVQEIRLEISPRSLVMGDKKMRRAFWPVVIQVGMMDVVFSIDSIMTAIGLTNQFWIMAVSISVAIIAMVFLSAAITKFIQDYPTVKMLALCFLFLIGTFLIADGFSFHIPREYLYVVLVFSLSIELLNIFRHKQHEKNQKK